MWRLRRRVVGAEYLRVGRHAVERWKAVDGLLSMAASQPIQHEALLQPQGLGEVLNALYPTVPEAAIAVLLESAWLPIVHVDVGADLPRAAMVEALVRHRLGLHHADGPDPVATWELRIEYRAGDRFAIGHGLAPGLKHSLLTTAKTMGLEVALVTSAFAWGWDRLRPDQRLPRSGGWWLWPEQDRTLVTRLALKGLVGLNPGAPSVLDESDVERVVEVERARLGIESVVGPISAATWDAESNAAGAGQRIKWVDVRVPGRAASLVPVRGASTMTKVVA